MCLHNKIHNTHTAAMQSLSHKSTIVHKLSVSPGEIIQYICKLVCIYTNAPAKWTYIHLSGIFGTLGLVPDRHRPPERAVSKMLACNVESVVACEESEHVHGQFI